MEVGRLPDTVDADAYRPLIAIPRDIPIGSWSEAFLLSAQVSTNNDPGFESS